MLLKRNCDISLSIAGALSFQSRSHERTGHWNHRRQWPLSYGRVFRHDGTSRRDAVRPRVGRAHRRDRGRATRLFFAAAWAGSPHLAARVEPPRQYLGAAFAQRALDHLRDRRWQFAGKIRAARCVVTIAIFRSHQSAHRPHVFWRRDCRAYFVC